MKFYCCLFLLIASLTVQAQDSSLISNYRAKIESIYTGQSTAFTHKDIKGILTPYDNDAVIMPEFHVSLFNKADIAEYFTKLLDSVKVTGYKRTIFEIKVIHQYLVESGTFTEDITVSGKPVYSYDGKYLHIWRIGSKGQLTLTDEIWGSVKPLDRSQIPLSTFVLPDTDKFPHAKPGKVLSAIGAINAQFSKLIVKSNGAAMADAYTADAIYMPYYMPMLIGKDAIRAYYVQHESPTTGIDTVSINVSSITDLGDYLFINGYYNVHWHAGTSSGIVTGKNLNIWKRSSTGEYLLYRQMVCHD